MIGLLFVLLKNNRIALYGVGQFIYNINFDYITRLNIETSLSTVNRVKIGFGRINSYLTAISQSASKSLFILLSNYLFKKLSLDHPNYFIWRVSIIIIVITNYSEMIFLIELS